MREILGCMDTPCSSYILILRETGKEALDYWEEHRKRYPTWGCLVFPDNSSSIISDIPPAPLGEGIHRVFFDAPFILKTDEEIIQIAKSLCPPYSEDDPIIDSEEPPCYVSSPRIVCDPPLMTDPLLLKNSLTVSRVQISMAEAHMGGRGVDDLLDRGVRSAKENVIKELLKNPTLWRVHKAHTPEGDVIIDVQLMVTKLSEPMRCDIGVGDGIVDICKFT